MSSVKFSDTWRTTTFRLVLLYGSMFAVGVVSLLALIYYDTANYIDQQTGQVLKAELHSYQVTPVEKLPKSFASDIGRDSRHIEIYGLFTPDKRLIAGNAGQWPGPIQLDGLPHLVPIANAGHWGINAQSIWGAAVELPSGEILFVGRKQIQLDEIRRVILKALGGAVAVILIGTFIGIRLSIHPIRRIREIQAVSQKIIHGDISLRLPKTGTDDELDMLATIVNRMLDEIAQRMRDIKASTDSIAHDLRTPLTHLRAMLNRMLHSVNGATDRPAIEQAIEEVDNLLQRFRAILRISEISGSMRRAMFAPVDLKPLLESIEEMYSPLAEEKNIALRFDLSAEVPPITGDHELLFEAILNLVDNAIKFTPQDGHVTVRLAMNAHSPRIEIENSGPGIPAEELNMVLQPFYRSQATRHLAGGHGVGLSIVTAIMHLHGFHLNLTSGNGLTRAVVDCRRP